MRETTPAAMPTCFDKWCQRFDDLLRTKAQKRECGMHRAADSGILNPASARFRNYLGVLLGESDRKNVSHKPLKTFSEALEAFRTAISYRFVEWLNHNRDVFAAYKASLGVIWA